MDLFDHGFVSSYQVIIAMESNNERRRSPTEDSRASRTRRFGDVEEELISTEGDDEEIPTQIPTQTQGGYSQQSYVPLGQPTQLSQRFYSEMSQMSQMPPQVPAPLMSRTQFGGRPAEYTGPLQSGAAGASSMAPAASKRARRGVNYTADEVNVLLDLVEKHLPLGGQMWEQVATEHSVSYPQTDRDAASLRKKFQDLYKKKVPTGDPHIPADVKRAKLLQQQILAQNAAADISQENGGFQGVAQSIAAARVSGETASGNDTDSNATNHRLDGTRPMISRRRSPVNQGNSQNLMEMFLIQQQMQAERDREERRESREMWMTMLAAGLGALSGNAGQMSRTLFQANTRNKKRNRQEGNRRQENDDDNSSVSSDND